MSHPDPLVMWADVARVAAEHPELGEDLIHALQERLIVRESRQPTIDELRAYVDQVSNLGARALRRYVVRPRSAKRKTGRTADRRVAPGSPRAEVGAKSGGRGVTRGPGRTEPAGAERGRQTRERIEAEQALSKGGPPPGGGLTRDTIIDAAIEHREPDGTWPTQTTVSLALGNDEGGRRIRQVQGPRRWAGILEDAEAKLANR